jgi:hypothetical protein
MTEETPVIRTADKDGDGPAKRRRRPALSCVECRSRKVKCDREKPCGACTRVQSTTCTYRPLRAGFGKRSPVTPSVSASGSKDQNHRGSVRSSPHPSAPSNQFDVMVNTYVAPGIFGEHGRPKLQPLPADRPYLNLNSRAKSSDTAVISHLLERIRVLENERTSTEDPSASIELPVRQDSDNGQFIKAKFYGQSHWMNAIDPVCLALLTTPVQPTGRCKIFPMLIMCSMKH